MQNNPNNDFSHRFAFDLDRFAFDLDRMPIVFVDDEVPMDICSQSPSPMEWQEQGDTCDTNSIESDMDLPSTVDLSTVGWDTDEDDISEALHHRSANQMMFEDSDYEDEHCIRNNVFLPQMGEEEGIEMMEIDENNEMMDIGGFIPNDEYQWIIRNLDDDEVMVGEEVLLDEPNWWNIAPGA